MADLTKAPPFSFSIDTSKMQEFAGVLSQWQVALHNAMLIAINKTLTQGRRKTAQLLAGKDQGKGKYNVLQKDVIDAVQIHRANRQQDFATGKLSVKPSRRVGLDKFEPKETRNGKYSEVSYRVLKGGAERTIPHAFMYPKSNPRWVAINVKNYRAGGKAHPNAGTKNRKQRLVFLQGISVWGMVAGLNNREKITDHMQAKLLQNTQKAVDFQVLVRTGQINVKLDKFGYTRRG